MIGSGYLNHSDRVTRAHGPNEGQSHRAALKVDATASPRVRKEEVSMTHFLCVKPQNVQTSC